MKIKTWIKYTKEYYPPRCRKPRFEELETYEDIELKEVTRKDVRMAYKVNDDVYFEYDGKLYIKATASSISNFKIEDPLENLKYCHENCSTYFGFEPYNTLTEMKTRAYKDLKRYLIIDGILYTVINIPMYELCVFGLGHNHGGTALMVSNVSNPHENTFSAKERRKAIDTAIKVALGRGDTNYIENIKKCPKIIEY